MKIKSLTIAKGIIEQTIINFNSNKNLIWSNENSQGKTTLLRFLLYSLGYKIPSTKKLDMMAYMSILLIENKRGAIKCIRDKNKGIIEFEDKTRIEFNLEKDTERLSFISQIFDIDNNPTLINNLLGAIYIDQEKGWTLLNRGKTIASNGFDIQDFLASLSSKDLSKIDSMIYQKEKEIRKYTSIYDVVTMSEQQQEDVKVDENLKLLYSKKNNKELLLQEKRNLLTQIKMVEENNNALKTVIDSYKLLVKHNNEEFILKTENIKDFDVNENIIKAKKSLIEIEIKNLENELANLKQSLKQYEGLFNVEDAGDSVVKAVNQISIDQVQLSHLIEKLKDEKSKLKEEKKRLIKSEIATVSRLATLVKEISTYLNVFTGYLENEGEYLFTHNLKAYTGTILHKVTFSYRLSYYVLLKEKTGLDFPMIIDSPGSAEMKIENINEILKILNEKCPESQIIVSSIYKDELIMNFDKTIEIENGLLSKQNY